MDVLQAYVRDADLFRDHAGAGLLKSAAVLRGANMSIGTVVKLKTPAAKPARASEIAKALKIGRASVYRVLEVG
jgi:hypothetical protein